MSPLLAKSRVFLPATTLKMCRPAVCHSTGGGATRHENNPEAGSQFAGVDGGADSPCAKVLEKGKQSVLRKHRKDSTEAPHWHEELASDAEAFVFLPPTHTLVNPNTVPGES